MQDIFDLGFEVGFPFAIFSGSYHGSDWAEGESSIIFPIPVVIGQKESERLRS